MPSAHNNLKIMKHPMSFTIQEIIPYGRFSYSSDSDELVSLLTYTQNPEGTRVSINIDGYELSLANLKAFLEGKRTSLYLIAAIPFGYKVGKTVANSL